MAPNPRDKLVADYQLTKYEVCTFLIFPTKLDNPTRRVLVKRPGPGSRRVATVDFC